VTSPHRQNSARSDVNFYFRLAAVAVAVFIMTILALVASLFGDPRAPLGRFLNEFGGVLIAGEVVVILVIAFLAMAVDRVRTLRKAQLRRDANCEESPSSPAEISPEEH
jgi:hypothetical protein